MSVLPEKVREAVRQIVKFPKGKASGIDNLPAELIKLDSDTVTHVCCKLCIAILNTYDWPEDWRRSVFVTISKVKGTTKCDEHQTIALISHAGKILLRILLKRMQKTAEEELADVQMGFWKGVSTRDQIYNLHIIQDYKKAFDSIKHAKLWSVIKTMGLGRRS